MFSTHKANDRGTEGISVNGPISSAATLIARGVKLEGEFTSQGDVVVEGEVQGTMKTSGKLSIGPEAKIVADITANEAVIAGTVQGNLHVANRMEMKSSAKIVGDIVAETVSIEAGAALSGRVSIGIKGTETPASAGNARPRASSAKEV